VNAVNNIDQALDQFEQAWQDSGPPDLRRIALGLSQRLPAAHQRQKFAQELVMIDFWHRWRSGAQGLGLGSARKSTATELPAAEVDDSWPRFPRLDEYAKRFPDLLNWTDLPPELIGEEYRARRWFGDHPSHDEYLRRYPQKSDQLRSVLEHIDAQTRKSLHDTTAPAPEPPQEPAQVAARPQPPRLPSIGKYQILAALDHGGQGRVYRAMHPELRQELAIKLGHPIASQDNAERDALVAEARVLAQLDHPNLVRVHDLGFHEHCPYVVLDYVPGRNLRDLTSDQRLTPQRAAEIVAQIARAVAAAHAHGITHLDLKPANILIDQHGQPRLIDFGLARQRSAWITTSETDELVAGTLLYMAPEQARGEAAQIGCRTDVFGLGAVLFDLLTGRPPRAAETIGELLKRARQGDVDAAGLSDTSIPPELAAICLKALSTDPQQRHDSAESLSAALEAWRDSTIAKPIRKRPIAIAAASIVALVGVGVVLLATGRAPRPADAVAEEQASKLVGHAPRHDFSLQFDLVGQRAGEAIQLQDGQAIAVRLHSEVDCYVGIWHVDDSGAATLLFPNDREQDHFLRAGQSLTVPGRDDYSVQVSASGEREYLWAAALTHPWDAEVGRARGPAIALSPPDELERGGKRAATLVARGGPRASERVIPLDVAPRNATAPFTPR
jgi:serine/threonine protein kinase